jgi:hypothetical protein
MDMWTLRQPASVTSGGLPPAVLARRILEFTEEIHDLVPGSPT